MRSLGDEVARRLEAIPNVDVSLIGVFRGVVGSLAVVDVGDARMTIPALGFEFPPVGSSVRLLRKDDVTVMLGPSPRASLGVVSVGATGPDAALVEFPRGSAVTQLMGVPFGLVVTAGDTVSIDWPNGGLIVNRYAAVTPVPIAADPAVTVTGSRTETFTAIDSGSFGARGWNTNDVWASDSYVGAWFFGSKLRDTIPDAAVIRSAQIYLPITRNSGASPVIGRHTSVVKPTGTVTFPATQTLVTRSGWVDIPTAWVDVFKVSGGGVGMNHGGYSIWAGVQKDAQSGALKISYTI